MTPREVAWEAEAGNRRATDERERQIVLAYQIERVRVMSHNNATQNRPMPSVKELLGRRQHTASGTAPRDQQAALFGYYAAMHNLKIREVRH